MNSVKNKISELFDALLTENARLNRINREQAEEIQKLGAELFHLKGQTQKSVSAEDMQ